MSHHGIDACEACGAVVAQCKCIGPHTTQKVSSSLCHVCNPKVPASPPSPAVVNLATAETIVAADQDETSRLCLSIATALDAKDATISDLSSENEKLLEKVKRYEDLDNDLLKALQENEKLAGMVKEYEECARKAVDDVSGMMLRLRAKDAKLQERDATIAALRAEVEQQRKWREGTEEAALKWEADFEATFAALTHHREAAKELVEVARDIEMAHDTISSFGRSEMGESYVVDRHDEARCRMCRLQRALSKYAFLTAPQEPKANDEGIAPEEGKPR